MKADWSKAPEWATLYTAEWRGSDRVDGAIAASKSIGF